MKLYRRRFVYGFASLMIASALMLGGCDSGDDEILEEPGIVEPAGEGELEGDD